jgi:hypothetical protein
MAAPLCDDRLLWDTWMSTYHFPALAVADEIGLFSALAEAPRTADEVAQKLSIAPRAAEALLGVLASLGYLSHLSGAFHLSEASRTFLLPQSRYYWGGVLRFFRSNPIDYASLLAAVRKGDAHIYEDKDIWKSHEVDPEQARLFTAHMHSHMVAPAVGAARRGPFHGVRRLLDVGGGSGVSCFALAREYPEMRCTVLDLPVVCDIAREYIAREELEGRVDTTSVDFFRDPFPAGYDAMLFSNVFHDWGREKCLHLARRGFEALPSGGRIYLHENPLDDSRSGPLNAASFSVLMTWATEGKQYSVPELERMLTECGFRGVTATPTYGYFVLISAQKP